MVNLLSKGTIKNIFQMDEVISEILRQNEKLSREKTSARKGRTPWNRQKKRCEVCGSYYLKLNKARHERSKKHKEAHYLWFDCFEVK